MNDLERYHDQVIQQKLPILEPPPQSESHSTSSLIIGIFQRWYIVLVTFFLMCAVGLPAIWLLVKPIYSVTGAIRVAPILSNILTGEADEGEISNYQSFVNTQAQMITSSRVVQRVADYLTDKKLVFGDGATKLVTKLKQAAKNTKATSEPANILKQAIFDGVIGAASERRTELIKITMKSTKPKEAKQIVDAFISAYMAVEVTSSAQGEDRKLTVLENERKVLAEKLRRQRETIHQLAQEYGTTTLGGRQDMMLQRVATLLAELTKVEARRINLEAKVRLLEETEEEAIASQELLKMRQEYINDDPIVRMLTGDIAQLDQGFIVAKQTLASSNPELDHKAKLIEALKGRLDELKEEAGKTFDDLMSKQLTNASNKKLLNAQTELEQTTAYEKRLREILAKEDTETIGLGRKQLTIQDLQDQLALTKEMYDTVRRRIQELGMERKRPARISVAYNADVSFIGDKRIKYTIALIFGSLACGILLALLRDKADHSLYTPDDVTKRLGVRIIGTTTNANYLDVFKLPQQVANDYQTIRANLGLLDGGGIPNKLVITSAGIRDGKTTFAINLATSLAKAGKRILLIDGDLRKPDIRWLLNLPKDSSGLQDVLSGKNFENVVYSLPLMRFDVLTADSQSMSKACELLSQPRASEYLNMVSAKYDHVIIDTPPVLAFSDALLWAKIADGVILTSFAGHTEEKDLREALERLAQIKVRVLGTILSSVRADSGYNRYGYSYANQTVIKSSRRRSNKTILLLPVKEGDESPDDSIS